MRFLAFFAAAVCLVSINGRSSAQGPRFLPIPPQMTPLHSQEGRELLQQCDITKFLLLAQFYDRQSDLKSCGVASCTTVLNALRIERPVSSNYSNGTIIARMFAEENIFAGDVASIVSRQKVRESGMSLSELGSILRVFATETRVVYASHSSHEAFRRDIEESFAAEDHFIIINYSRSAVGQIGGGHISPLSAYHASSGNILVMDTANYRYPWVWIGIDYLWDAMELEVDSSSGRSRGYVVVSK